MLKKIVQVEPFIDESEFDQLRRVIDSTYVTEHKLTTEFENLTNQLTGSPYSTAICNGTCALFCALKSCNIGKGDEVIVPNITFIATATAVLLTGASVRLVDVDPETGCIDPLSILNSINRRTKAIMPVHLYGVSCDMHFISEIADQYSLEIIEDAAQGVGVFYKNQHVGSFGRYGILSYYGNKTITTGEGGIVLSKNHQDRKEIYKLKNHGRSAKGTFLHESLGWNFSFTEMQAAVGISQMNKLPRIIKKKCQIFDYYQTHISNVNVVTRSVPVDTTQAVHWFSNVHCKNTDRVANFLADHHIPSRRVFNPLHTQPALKNNSLVKGINHSFQGSRLFFDRVLSLPSSYFLEEEQLEYICNVINKL